MRGVLTFGRFLFSLPLLLSDAVVRPLRRNPQTLRGQYVLSGTIDGFPNSDITGTISITGQSG